MAHLYFPVIFLSPRVWMAIFFSFFIGTATTVALINQSRKTAHAILPVVRAIQVFMTTVSVWKRVNLIPWKMTYQAVAVKNQYIAKYQNKRGMLTSTVMLILLAVIVVTKSWIQQIWLRTLPMRRLTVMFIPAELNSLNPRFKLFCSMLVGRAHPA